MPGKSGKYFKEVLTAFYRNWTVGFLSFITIAVALFILGVFIILTLNVSYAAKIFEKNLQVQIFLEDNIGSTELNKIGDYLESSANVYSFVYVPPEEALKEMKGRLDGSVAELIKGNPFPASFRVSMESLDYVDEFIEDFRGFSGIESIGYGGEMGESIQRILKIFITVTLGLALFLWGAAGLIISNTVSLTIVSRREEIEVMKLIGAADKFIAMTFLMEGVALGLTAGFISFFLLWIAYISVSSYLTDLLPFLVFSKGLGTAFVVFLSISGCGVAAGFFGSVVSVKKALSSKPV